MTRTTEPIDATAVTTTDVASGRRSVPHRMLTTTILWYQRAREGRPSPCRFFPSCSAYALEAVEVHGSRRGTWLAAKRLARCRPLGPSGFDPVPEPGITPGDAPGDAPSSAPGACVHPLPDSSPDPIAGQR